MFTTGTYKIAFKKLWHDRRRPLSKGLRESKAVKMPETNGRYDTVCEIYVKDETMVGKGFEIVHEKVPRFTGIAKLHPNDHADRVVGKKVALRKALGKEYTDHHGNRQFHYNCVDFYNRSVRDAIWKAFWKWVSLWPKQVAPKPITQKPR